MSIPTLKRRRPVAISHAIYPFNEPRLTLDDLRGVIKAKGMTNLCAPRELRVVKEIPKLGTGKTNYRELQAEMAQAT